jgi:hypothetical protein
MRRFHASQQAVVSRRGLKSLTALALFQPLVALAAAPVCEVVSGERLTPVIELYTSEGCSSCPPADQWLSTLKGQPVVAQAFHVAYWDYIGWKDRFASPSFTARQKDVAAANRLRSIYTPQVVRNGRDWANWHQASTTALAAQAVARANIRLQRGGEANSFEARVTPTDATAVWSAYWSVTEHGHSSRVKAGENSGEYLKHDFVVRQYTPVGRYQGPQALTFYAIAAQPEHPRQINLIVSDAQTGEPWQAVSLSCS